MARLLRSTLYASRPHVSQDIEEDPSRLLSTGLFKSCRPVVFPPKRTGEFYPTFLRVTSQQTLTLGWKSVTRC